jgi:hypothetical protein
MVIALLALPVAPANAVATAACPATIPSAGFTDLGGLSVDAVDAVNCIAFYNISKGTSATTYDPAGNVNRWQMALFLTRQATAHGVTLPSGADQGFTDLTGLSAEATTAVNQLKQLAITTGTTATTYDPFGNVSRWQMALFITRLVDAAGIVLPSGADQGFTDLTGLSAAAVTAVNQLKQLTISTGTSATTFDPFATVSRWQMALFLARTLQAGGVTPAGVITVTPTAAAQLNLSGTPAKAVRQYTATVSGASTVSLQLWSGKDVNTSGLLISPTSTAAGATISVVNGVSSGAVAATDVVKNVTPSSGTVTFTVEYTAQNTDGVFPAVFAGTAVTGLAGASATAPKAPTNSGFGVGGASTVLNPAASAATVGPGVAIDSVNKTANYIIAGGAAWFYDDNDSFKIAGVPKTPAAFEAELSSGDTIGIAPYSADAALVSAWDLADLAPLAPTAALVSVTDTTAKFTYTVATGATSLNVYRAATGTTPVLVKTVPATTDNDTVLAGLQYVGTGLTAATSYDYQFAQIVDGEVGAKTAIITPVLTTAASQVVAITAIDVQDVNDGLGTWTQVKVTLDKVVSAPAAGSFSINPTSQPGTSFVATLAAVDGTGKILTLTFAAQNDPSTDINWTLKMAAAAATVTGPPAGPSAATSGTFAH